MDYWIHLLPQSELICWLSSHLKLTPYIRLDVTEQFLDCEMNSLYLHFVRGLRR
jgi:hypothetical protein